MTAKGNEEADDRKDLIAIARERFERCVEAERELRQEAEEDLKFLAGEQWPEEIRRERELSGRPCLTINQLPVLLRQVTNAQRQNKVSAKVSPFDDKADVDTADVIQGVIRSIEYNSNAAGKYTQASFYAAGIGFGFVGIERRYCDPRSMDQDIRIVRCKNPFQWYLDPEAIEPDGSDAEFGFKFADYTKESFRAAFPKATLAGIDDWSGAAGSDAREWLTEDGVRVLEYYYKDYVDDTVLRLQNPAGDTIDILESELRKLPVQFRKKVRVVSERETKLPTIKWAQLTIHEVLDETEEPGEYIPMVRIVGDEFDINGKLKRHGMVRNAKDAQRQSNYMRSAQVEAIALAPKSPFIAAAGQIEGHEDKWDTANKENHPYLPYNPVDINGDAVPAPTRLNTEANISAITQAVREAETDLHNTSGIFAAQQGAPSNEQSGIAINQRKQQGELGSYHYIDNTVMAIAHVCRILVQWIPSVYDTKRTVRIVGEDESHKVVKINQAYTEKGKEKSHMLSIGKYDVVCEAGPSWATKLQEAADRLTAIAQRAPFVMQIAGDLIMRALNVPYGNEIAERLQKMLPAQLQENNGEDGPQIPPEIQQKFQAMFQQNQKLIQTVHELSGTLETKQLELQSKERIAKLQAIVTLLSKEADVEGKLALGAMNAELTSLQSKLDAVLNPPAPPAGAEDEGQPGAGDAGAQPPNGGADAGDAGASSEPIDWAPGAPPPATPDQGVGANA